VAYQALELGDETVARYATAWGGSRLVIEPNAARLGGSRAGTGMVKVPGDAEWATDPIASRLKDRASLELRQSVVRLAAEAQRKP